CVGVEEVDGAATREQLDHAGKVLDDFDDAPRSSLAIEQRELLHDRMRSEQHLDAFVCSPMGCPQEDDAGLRPLDERLPWVGMIPDELPDNKASRTVGHDPYRLRCFLQCCVDSCAEVVCRSCDRLAPIVGERDWIMCEGQVIEERLVVFAEHRARGNLCSVT